LERWLKFIFSMPGRVAQETEAGVDATKKSSQH
jgi:hypothetical protein